MGRQKRKGVGNVDAREVWAEIEEYFVPFMRARLVERLVYSHLVRKLRLEGKRRMVTSVGELARTLYVSKNPVRTALRTLAKKGALRIVQRDYDGHEVEVRLPREIPGCVRKEKRREESLLAREDCYKSGIGRLAIFAREKNRCFYCLRQLDTRSRTLDHVRPRSRGGKGSYRNVVACCPACNALKHDATADDFLRRLHRMNLISRKEFYRRMTALEDLRKGRLRPELREAA